MSSPYFILYVSQASIHFDGPPDEAGDPSKNEVTGKSLDSEALQTLQEKAELRSSHKDLTGVLIYRRGYYLHYVEGSEIEVLTFYQRLRGARRHFNMKTLSRGTLFERLFTTWDIHFVQSNADHPSSQSLIDLFEAVLSTKTASHSEISAILKRFGRHSERFGVNPLQISEFEG